MALKSQLSFRAKQLALFRPFPTSVERSGAKLLPVPGDSAVLDAATVVFQHRRSSYRKSYGW